MRDKSRAVRAVIDEPACLAQVKLPGARILLAIALIHVDTDVACS